MVRRFAVRALLLCAPASLLFVVSAGAQTPSPNSNYQGCQAFLSDVSVRPGQTITISGSGANPGDTVTATIAGSVGTLGTGTGDATGNFSFPGTIPATAAPGAHAVTVACGPNGGVANITVTVGTAGSGSGPVTTVGAGAGNGQGSGSGGAGNGALPRTGADRLIPLVKLGVVLVAAGGLILAASRRRRWAQQPALQD